MLVFAGRGGAAARYKFWLKNRDRDEGLEVGLGVGAGVLGFRGFGLSRKDGFRCQGFRIKV